MTTSSAPISVCALYKFTSLKDYTALKSPFLNRLKQLNIKGTLLLAEEGINGTIAGSQEAINCFLDWLKQDQRFADIDYKLSEHHETPFLRTRVKLKKEIVTMGVDGIDPNQVVGTYVEPKNWNQLITDPNTLLIDTRNEYEYGIGSFVGAQNPHTETFREFPDYVKQQLDPDKHKKIAMFCTGGIRCEKASAYLKQQGFAEVYHLQGGILKYLEQVDQADSLWQGECFVFDDRVAVTQDLKKGSFDQCHACRYPITEHDKTSRKYLPGVSCPRCHDELTEEQKQRFAEREKQIKLAKQRGENHIGDAASKTAERNRQAKQQRRKSVE